MAGCGLSATTVALLQPTPTILAIWAGWASALSLRNRRGEYDQVAGETNPMGAGTPTPATTPRFKIL